MARAKGQVRVAGTCAAGHVTRTVSDPGRNTWEGTCGEDGCDLHVKARRIPAERIPSPAATAAGKPPAQPDPYAVVEVDTYDTPQPARKRPPDPGPVDTAGPPAGSPIAPLRAADEPGGGAADEPAGDDGGQHRAGWRQRLRRRDADRGPVEFRTPFDA